MNRKRVQALTRKVEQAKKLHFLSVYDDPINWLHGDIPCPWTPQQIADYQKQLDSAFGAEKGIVLAWSLDRQYWDEFYDDWHITGLPKGRLAKKPILLWNEIAVNDGQDHLYISVPRWMLLERLHGSQLADSWEESAWVEDENYIGGRKRIRAESPPEYFYQMLKPPLNTLAIHEAKVSRNGDMAPCCRRIYNASRNICYGKYRSPCAEDLLGVKQIRINQDRAGIIQRNDAPRSAKIINSASDSTRHFMQQAARRKASAVKELILGDPQGYMGAVFERYNIDLSAREIDSTLRTALEQAEEQRFEETIC